MATRKFRAGASLALGLAVSLLAQQATATEELVVYGSAPAKAEARAFRAEVESYLRAMHEQLRKTLDADLKRALAPRIEVESSELQARG
jgi:citrate synthase